MNNKINIKSKYVQYFLIAVMMILVSNGSNLTQNNFIFISFFAIVLLLVIKKIRIQRFIVVLISVWLIINAITYFEFQNISGVSTNTFLSVTAKLLIPYLLLSALNKKVFFLRIENVLFFLAATSIVFYFLQIIFLDLFYSIAPLLNTFTNPEQQANGGWYIFVYMFNGYKAAYRNSGFMWEPGAFSFMLFVAIFIRFKINNFSFDKKIFIYFLAILTTISTTAYLVLFILTIGLILKYRNELSYAVGIPIVVAFGIITFSQADFLGSKIEKYSDRYDEIWAVEIDGEIIRRYNRFGILDFHYKEALIWPIGYGIFEATPAINRFGENVVGPNNYAQILNRWGFLGIFLFLYAVYRMIKLFYHKQKIVVQIMLFLAFCTATFSYNLLNNYFLILLLFYPFIRYRKVKKKIKSQNEISNSILVKNKN